MGGGDVTRGCVGRVEEETNIRIGGGRGEWGCKGEGRKWLK